MVVHIIATNTKRKILPNLKGKGYLIFKILNNKMCVRSSTSQCHVLLEFGLWELRGIIGSWVSCYFMFIIKGPLKKIFSLNYRFTLLCELNWFSSWVPLNDSMTNGFVGMYLFSMLWCEWEVPKIWHNTKTENGMMIHIYMNHKNYLIFVEESFTNARCLS